MSLARLRSAFCGFLAMSVLIAMSGCQSDRAEIAVARSIPEGSQVYDVVLVKHGGKKIGQVTVDKEYRLQVVSVIASKKDFLTEIVDVMNAKTNLHAEAAPPEGAPRFSEFSRVVDRSSPEFFTQLQAHLKQYYDLVLQPAAK